MALCSWSLSYGCAPTDSCHLWGSICTVRGSGLAVGFSSSWGAAAGNGSHAQAEVVSLWGWIVAWNCVLFWPPWSCRGERVNFVSGRERAGADNPGFLSPWGASLLLLKFLFRPWLLARFTFRYVSMSAWAAALRSLGPRPPQRAGVRVLIPGPSFVEHFLRRKAPFLTLRVWGLLIWGVFSFFSRF